MTMTTTTTTMTNDRQPTTVDDRRWATMGDDARHDDGRRSDIRTVGGRRRTQDDGRSLGWSTDDARMVGARIVDSRRSTLGWLMLGWSTVNARMVDALMVDGRRSM